MAALLAFFTLRVICVVLLAGLIALALWASVRLPAKNSSAAGGFYRFVNPSYYLKPAERICHACGYRSAATALRCTNPDHPAGQPDELSEPGETLTRESTRLWGLRILIGLILLASLWINHPFAIYAVIATTTLWIVMPLMTSHRAGQTVFWMIMGTIVIGTGIINLLLPAQARHKLAVVNHRLLPPVSIGPVHVALGAGQVTLGAVLLNELCCVAALASIVLGYLSHRQNHADDDFYGPLTVAFLATCLSALGLYALSTLQGLDGIAYLYLLLVIVSFGWLLAAFVERAVMRSLARMKVPPARIRFVPISKPSSPRPRQLAGRDIFDQLAYALERVALSTSYTAMSVLVALLNTLIRLATGLANFLLRVVEWVVGYIRAVMRTLLTDLVVSLPTVFRLSVAGARTMIVAPGLMLIASLLLAACAAAAALYLQLGGPERIGLALLTFAGAALCTSIAASFYVDWSLIRSFIRAITEDYLAQAIVFFAVYLDAYGLERWILHAPSHFGLISWALNLLLIIAALRGFTRSRTRQSQIAPPQP